MKIWLLTCLLTTCTAAYAGELADLYNKTAKPAEHNNNDMPIDYEKS